MDVHSNFTIPAFRRPSVLDSITSGTCLPAVAYQGSYASKYYHGSRRDKKPKFTVLARISSNLTDPPDHHIHLYSTILTDLSATDGHRHVKTVIQTLPAGAPLWRSVSLSCDVKCAGEYFTRPLTVLLTV
jgi:hypothetical protein